MIICGKEVLSLKPPASLSDNLEDMTRFLHDAFDENGVLASLIPGFENRPQQLDMARSVLDSLYNGKHLLVEAGTGVGKSLAYLIPAVYWCLTTKNRLVVSTHTVNLQQQLVNKDIPLVSQVLDGMGTFNYALFKGRSHYLCLRKWNRVYEDILGRLKLVQPDKDELVIENISELIDSGTWNGDKDTLPFTVSEAIWSNISSESDRCMSSKCPFRESCFYMKQRRYLEGCHLIVVNHALFAAHLRLFVDTSGKTSLIPAFESAIFDEAHHIDEVFRDSLTFDIGYNRVRRLADDTSRLVSRHPFSQLVPKDTQNRLRFDLDQLLSLVETNLSSLDPSSLSQTAGSHGRTRRANNHPGDRNKCRLMKPGLLDEQLIRSFKNLAAQIANWVELDLSDEERFETSALAKRYVNMASIAERINTLEGDSSSFVYWSEVEERGRQHHVTLKGSPLEIDSYLYQNLWSSLHSAILTSATLSTDNSFDYIKSVLGINAEEAIFGSPFDYANQVCLCIPGDVRGADPNKPGFDEYVSDTILDIVDLVQGRTFILFTSRKSLRNVSAATRDKIEEKGFPVLVQDEMPRETLLLEYKKAGNAVLMGLDSFWEGVDVPGEALSCVVITRLPFPVPNDPVMRAREDRWMEQGLSPFMHYSLPIAILKLKQGFGRLIRSKTDSGAVVILDSRILTKNYGKAILRSLPPATLANDLYDITKFISYTVKKRF